MDSNAQTCALRFRFDIGTPQPCHIQRNQLSPHSHSTDDRARSVARAIPALSKIESTFSRRRELRRQTSLDGLFSGGTRGNIGIAFNPYTGEIGTNAARNNFAGKLHQFHLRLLLDNAGQTIVGWTGPLLLLLSITGLVLWWPRKIFRVNWRTSWKSVNFDLHQALGIWASLFLMLFAIADHRDSLGTRGLNRRQHRDELARAATLSPPSSTATRR